MINPVTLMTPTNVKRTTKRNRNIVASFNFLLNKYDVSFSFICFEIEGMNAWFSGEVQVQR
jgi:hypothetical protein